MASAGYVENWFLSVMSVNYSALNDQATVAQHYWSLSVEEQFYLVWPLLLIGASWWAAVRSARRRVVAAALLIALVAVSFTASLLATASMSSPAYFVTYTRAWEFGIGGLLALALPRPLPRIAANVLSVAGFAAIACSAPFFGLTTSFPGSAVLAPVLGTAAVIATGTGREGLWHEGVTGIRPVQWLGDVSYSLYLWHWPLIVLVPFAIGSAVSDAMRIGILMLALVFAAAAYRFVERPGQRWTFLTASSRRTFLGMAAAMTAVIVAGGGLVLAGRAVAQADMPPVSVVTEECVGRQALTPGVSCPDAHGPAADILMGPGNAYFAVPSECAADPGLLPFAGKTATVVCDFSAGAADPAGSGWSGTRMPSSGRVLSSISRGRRAGSSRRASAAGARSSTRRSWGSASRLHPTSAMGAGIGPPPCRRLSSRRPLTSC